MEANGIEKEVLEELTKRLVMNKQEIMKFIEERVGNSDSVLDGLMKSLLEEGYVTSIAPMGTSCYAVTTKGIKTVGIK